MQITLVTGIVDNEAEAGDLAKRMNTFLTQHSNDVIESVQITCTSVGGGIGAASTRAIGLIAYEPRPHTKRAAKKKAKK